MKILFLANRTPYPPYRGDKLKIFNLAKRLCKKHELHLITFAESDEDFSYEQELKKIFKEVHLVKLPRWKSALNCATALWNSKPLQVLYFQSGEMQRVLDEQTASHQYDAIHVQHLRMSPYLAYQKHLPRILDLPDAFSLYWERRKQIPRGFMMRMLEQVEQKRVLRYEEILNHYQMSLVCSAEDLNYLKQTHHVSNIRLLPNGVDTEAFAPQAHDYGHNHTLLFTGNMDYAPNVDAVIYFVKELLPEIQKHYPQVKFVIAGQRPVKKILELSGPSVEITGFVPKLSDMYNKASIMVAPLRFGAGTQNKVLEAMSMGIPVICSHIGFGGLGIASGEGAIMAPDKASFIKAVLELLESREKREEVGKKGIEVILQNFGWDSIALLLEQYLEEVQKTK